MGVLQHDVHNHFTVQHAIVLIPYTLHILWWRILCGEDSFWGWELQA